MMEAPSYRYEAYLRCSEEQAWHAITDPDSTAAYYYGTTVESEWTPGSSINYYSREGTLVADGDILGIEPPHRLEMTFTVRWEPELEAEGPTRMAWVVESRGRTTRVAVEYYDLNPASERAIDFAEGVPYIVSGMKTLLETGTPLEPAAET